MKILALITILILSQGCVHFDPFVSLRPLFVGLDETGMSAKARTSLAEAKQDFALARKNMPPQYARSISHDPNVGAKRYQGRGYQLTIFSNGLRHRVGQKIEVEPAITGGRSYFYDESHEQWD